MIDEEVEIVLREIRERVHSLPPPEHSTSGAAGPIAGNGAGDSLLTPEEENRTVTDALARINSYLTTTGRAWDRLPPVYSNRSGPIARLELWLKTRFKSLTRWFTWEQVNFNAAVHHALQDTVDALSETQQALEMLRAQINAASESRRALQTELRAESENRRVEIQAVTGQLHASLWAESEARRIELERCQTEINVLRVAIEQERVQGEARLAELRERDGQLQDEQRACFKQLSLESSEAAVVDDRARRKVDVALEELTRRIKEMERVMSHE
jgi:hypothetical protein